MCFLVIRIFLVPHTHAFYFLLLYNDLLFLTTRDSPFFFLRF